MGAWSTCVNGSQTRWVGDSNNCNTTIGQPATKQSCTTSTCTPNWVPGSWSTCVNGSQSRTVVDYNSCDGGGPASQYTETQSCILECTTKWQPGPWQDCINGTQKRTAVDVNSCGVDTGDKPETTQSCALSCTPNWQESPWASCNLATATQTRTVTDLNSCGVDIGKPITTQSCTYTCSPNWFLGPWNGCSNNTQTRAVTDINICGVDTFKPSTKQICGGTCTPDWVAQFPWSNCVDGNQTRNVVDLNNCGVDTANKPEATKSCSGTCVPEWQMGEWNSCLITSFDTLGTQTRTVTDINSCGIDTGKPDTNRSCGLRLYIIISSKPPYDLIAVSSLSSFALPPLYIWQAGPWGMCKDGVRTRIVTGIKGIFPYNSIFDKFKPAETESCSTVSCTPKWQTNPWSYCNPQPGGTFIQTRTVTDTNYCENDTKKPVTKQACSIYMNPGYGAFKLIGGIDEQWMNLYGNAFIPTGSPPADIFRIIRSGIDLAIAALTSRTPIDFLPQFGIGKTYPYLDYKIPITWDGIVTPGMGIFDPLWNYSPTKPVTGSDSLAAVNEINRLGTNSFSYYWNQYWQCLGDSYQDVTGVWWRIIPGGLITVSDWNPAKTCRR